MGAIMGRKHGDRFMNPPAGYGRCSALYICGAPATQQFKSNAIFSHLHNPYDPALAVGISSLNKVEFAMLAACLPVCLACSWWGRDSSWGLDGQQAMCGTMEGYGGINLQGWTGVCL